MTVLLSALLSEELESLRQLAGEAILPVLHGNRLVHCGYARIRAGVPIITTLGRAKLALEITRASWLNAPG